MRLLVDAGLRGKMEMQSFVTDQLAVALDMHPDSPLNYLGIEKKYPEIPTLPTDLQKLAKTLEDIPFDEMVEDVRQTLSGIRDLVNSRELTHAIESLYGALGSLDEVVKDFGKLARNLDSRVGPVASSIEDTMRDAQKLVQNVDGQIELCETELAHHLIGRTKAPCREHSIEYRPGQKFAGLVVPGESMQSIELPAPVLHDLRR